MLIKSTCMWFRGDANYGGEGVKAKTAATSASCFLVFLFGWTRAGMHASEGALKLFQDITLCQSSVL